MHEHRPLSYSAWSTWEQCPAKYKFSYIDKLPRRPPGPQADRGTDVHKSVDDYLTRKSEEVHHEIRSTYGQWLMAMRELPHKLVPELRFAINKDWEVVPYHDPTARWRGFIDLAVEPQEGEEEIDGYEWKTGGVYDHHLYQSSLYGTVLLCLYENAQRARVTNVYFDKKKVVPRQYERSDLEGMKFLWQQQYEDLHKDDIMPPNPGWYCRYCDFGKAAGGPCAF